jgi:hypothetical protein
LAEQRRIYDLEAAKEERDRIRREGLEDKDRAKLLADERGVMASRQNAFGGFGANLSQFSQGYAPALGMSAEQTAGMLAGRNQGMSGGMPVAPRTPDMGAKGLGQTAPGVPAPWMPTPVNNEGAGSLTSTVWLQAPTGETLEVPIDKAGPFLQKGAVMIPRPTGGR